MAIYVGNVFEDIYPEKVEIQKTEFYDVIESDVVPFKALSEGNLFYSSIKQNEDGESETIFVIFNDVQNVYYLFSSVG